LKFDYQVKYLFNLLGSLNFLVTFKEWEEIRLREFSELPVLHPVGTLKC